MQKTNKDRIAPITPLLSASYYMEDHQSKKSRNLSGRLLDFTIRTPKTVEKPSTFHSITSKLSTKLLKHFRPEYTSTPSYSLPKTSTPVLNRSKTSTISIVAITKFNRVNSTFKDDIKFKKLVVKKLFKEKHSAKLQENSNKQGLQFKYISNRVGLSGDREVGYRIKKINQKTCQRGLVTKSRRVVEKFESKKYLKNCSKCRSLGKDVDDFLLKKQMLDVKHGEHLLNQLLYTPGLNFVQRRVGKSRGKDENLIRLENINFNFYTRS